MRIFQPILFSVGLACAGVPLGCDEPDRPPPRTAADRKKPRFVAERLFDVIRVRRDDRRACKATGGRFLPSLNADDKKHVAGFLFYHCVPDGTEGQHKDWRLQLHATCYSAEPITEQELRQMGGFACKHGDWGASWTTVACKGETDCQRTDPIKEKEGKRIGEGLRWTPGQARDWFTGDSVPAMVW